MIDTLLGIFIPVTYIVIGVLIAKHNYHHYKLRHNPEYTGDLYDPWLDNPWPIIFGPMIWPLMFPINLFGKWFMSPTKEVREVRKQKELEKELEEIYRQFPELKNL